MEPQSEPWYGHKFKEYPDGVWRCNCGANLIQQACNKDSTSAQSVAERQAAYRARKAAAKLHEVRGIFLPQALHAALKEHARKLLIHRVSPNTQTPAKREN